MVYARDRRLGAHLGKDSVSDKTCLAVVALKQLIHPAPSMLPCQALSPPTILDLLLSYYSDDWNSIYWGGTVTVEIPSKQWTLVIGMDDARKKWTATVNGMKVSELPKASMTAASQPQFCKSSDRFKYSETIRSVTHTI